MARRKNATLAVGVGCCAFSLVVAGTAYAYWTSTGAGSGASTTANGLTTFSTTATVPQGSLLYPGSSAPLTVNVNNSSNSYGLIVTLVALDGGRSITVDSAHAAGCTSPALSVTRPGGWTGITVAANSSSGAVNISGAVSMGLASSSGCQGATFSIPVTLTGRNS